MTEQLARIPVTGCVMRYPMVDRHGRRLHVGDRVRAQVCVGRYGQTAIVETTVTEAHEPYGHLGAGKHAIRFELHQGRLVGHYVHHDVEHGHETWAEIID